MPILSADKIDKVMNMIRMFVLAVTMIGCGEGKKPSPDKSSSDKPDSANVNPLPTPTPTQQPEDNQKWWREQMEKYLYDKEQERLAWMEQATKECVECVISSVRGYPVQTSCKVAVLSTSAIMVRGTGGSFSILRADEGKRIALIDTDGDFSFRPPIKYRCIAPSELQPEQHPGQSPVQSHGQTVP